jgi:hypothetical protein
MNGADRLLVHAFKNERGFVATFSGSRAAVGEKALDAPRSAYFRYPKESTRALDWIRSEDAGGVETVRSRGRRRPCPRRLWSPLPDGNIITGG